MCGIMYEGWIRSVNCGTDHGVVSLAVAPRVRDVRPRACLLHTTLHHTTLPYYLTTLLHHSRKSRMKLGVGVGRSRGGMWGFISILLNTARTHACTRTHAHTHGGALSSHKSVSPLPVLVCWHHEPLCGLSCVLCGVGGFEPSRPSLWPRIGHKKDPDRIAPIGVNGVGEVVAYSLRSHPPTPRLTAPCWSHKPRTIPLSGLAPPRWCSHIQGWCRCQGTHSR